jgi:glycosyltransferase involved in cell wall biosynthesis
VRSRAGGGVIAERIRFDGAVPQHELERRYAEADLLVLPSRGETYGMVVTEALARGVPVVASKVGGIPEALGRARAGCPGLLVPAGNAGALAAALRRWLSDATLRAELRAAAAERRSTLTGWAVTASRVDEALASAAA